MKRFIDLRLSETGYKFAWYNTIIDKFEEFNGNQTWDTRKEFLSDFNAHEKRHIHDADRYIVLFPQWVY